MPDPYDPIAAIRSLFGGGQPDPRTAYQREFTYPMELGRPADTGVGFWQGLLPQTMPPREDRFIRPPGPVPSFSSRYERDLGMYGNPPPQDTGDPVIPDSQGFQPRMPNPYDAPHSTWWGSGIREGGIAEPSPPPGMQKISDTGDMYSQVQGHGLLEQGNIDLNARPMILTPSGKYATVQSMNFEEDGRQILVPMTAADGSRMLSTDEAVDQYHRTGQHLGIFDSEAAAHAYAKMLHESQEKQYDPREQDLFGKGNNTLPR